MGCADVLAATCTRTLHHMCMLLSAGCFGDQFGVRALPVQLRVSPTMTVDECAQLAYNARGTAADGSVRFFGGPSYCLQLCGVLLSWQHFGHSCKVPLLFPPTPPVNRGPVPEMMKGPYFPRLHVAAAAPVCYSCNCMMPCSNMHVCGESATGCTLDLAGRLALASVSSSH
jgi:hypothetical protein